MALESFSTLSIESSGEYYFFLACNIERGPRSPSIMELLEDWEWDGLEREDLNGSEVCLVPIQLLKFNQTENEE